MKKLRPLPDLTKLSAAEKDRLILNLQARLRALHAELGAEESARLLTEIPQFLAGEANKRPSAKPGDVGK